VAFGIDSATINSAVYATERFWLTWGPGTLNPGPTQALSLSGWGTVGGDKLLRIRAMAATQASGVQVQVTTDATVQAAGANYTAGWPAGLRAMPVRLDARQSLQVTIQNSSGAAINNFNLNLALDIIHAPNYTPPPPLEVARINTWDPARLSDPAVSGSWLLDASSTTGGGVITGTVPANEVWVLDALALEGAPTCVVTVSRDNHLDYFSVNGAAFQQADDAPWDLWIPIVKTFQVVATQGPGLVPVRVHLSRYQLTPALQKLLGLSQ